MSVSVVSYIVPRHHQVESGSVFSTGPPSGVYTPSQGPYWAFSIPGWATPALWSFSHRRVAPVPSSFYWLFTGLSPVYPHLSCTEEPNTGPGTAGVTSAKWRVLSKWRVLHLEPALAQGHTISSQETWCPLEPQVLSYEAAFQLGVPQPILVRGFVPLHVLDWGYPSFMRFLSTHFSNLLRSLSIAA